MEGRSERNGSGYGSRHGSRYGPSQGRGAKNYDEPKKEYAGGEGDSQPSAGRSYSVPRDNAAAAAAVGSSPVDYDQRAVSSAADKKRSSSPSTNDYHGERKNEESAALPEPSQPAQEPRAGGEVEVKTYDTFDEMGLKENVLRGVYAYGFEKPSVIQQKAIVPLKMGYDLIAQAQSGSGKTGAFAVGVLERIEPEGPPAQALVLLPTRELAMQVANVFAGISDYSGLRIQLCIGGTPMRGKRNAGVPSLIEERKGHVVVATPGRILDMFEKQLVNADNVKILVLDEADEMLSEGFSEDIKRIFRMISKTAQIALFSATLPPAALEITDKFMNSPLSIIVKKEEVTLQGILQYAVCVEYEDNKFSTLCDLYERLSITQAVIFCNSKRKVEWLSDMMAKQEFTVSSTHGALDHAERMKIMEDFRNGHTRVLITTDLLARGIDVQQVSLVINYDLPMLKETYVHRIGRSGRFGRKGVAITMVTDREIGYLKQLEHHYETFIDALPSNLADLPV